MIRNLLMRKEHLDKTAVIEETREYTYLDLAQKATAVEARLAHIEQGNIAILLNNGADYIAALFGVWMAGKTAFPLSVQLTAHEVLPLITQATARAVITSSKYRSFFTDSDLKAGTPELIFIDDLHNAEQVVKTEASDGVTDETIVLLTTSGTTGHAKIVQLTERNIETAVQGYLAYNDYPRFSDVDIRYILAAPFSSVYGLLIIPSCIMNAFPLVVINGPFTLDAFYSAAERYRVTHYEGGTAIPILMDQMSGRDIPYDISSLRFVGFGGSKVAAEVLFRLDQTFPQIEFCPGYGMTESAAMIARPYKRVKLNKRDSTGTAIPKVTVRVDTGAEITDAPLAMGELVVRGPNVTPGYYRNEEETRKIIKDGWLYTGDIGYIDEDGDIFICGRKKNVVMVRGFSVYAEEVEAALHSSGLVKECAVYGRADSAGNEILCADIVPLSKDVDERGLSAWCAGHLAAYKQPQRIRLTDAIAKTSTGKIDRTAEGKHEAD